MNVKTVKVFLIFVLLVASIIPMIQAPSDTASPSQSNDDAMRTGIGAYFGDTAFLTLQDEVVDIVTGIRFRGVDVPQGAKINNATLYVRSVYAYPIGDADVTLTGDDADNSRAFNDSGSFNRIYTLAFKVWDVSEVFGTVLANVSITEIVQEIVDRPGWSSGNDLSLIMFSESGSPRREFVSWDGSWEDPWIVVWFDEELTQEEIEEEIQDQAETPFNKTDEYVWEKNDTYRGIDIYDVTQFGDPEFQFIGRSVAQELWYQNSSKAAGDERRISKNELGAASGAVDPIISIGDWTLSVIDNGSMNIMVSDDEFQTFFVFDPNDEYNLAPWAGNGGSFALDPNDGETIHFVWTSPTPAHVGVFNVIYTNFTVNPDTGVLTFAPSYTNLTQVGSTQFFPNIYCQENGTLHVVYWGNQGDTVTQIYYRRRLPNGTWLAQVQVSDTDVAGDPHTQPDVVANEDTGLALVIWEFDDTDNYWDVVYPNNTDDVDRLMNTGIEPAMVNYRENNTAYAVWASQVGQPSAIYHQSKSIDNSSAWSANMQVSPVAEKHFAPDIGIDPINKTAQAIWYNDWNVWVAGNFWNLGEAPTPGKTRLTNEALLFNWIEDEFNRKIVDTFQFLVYPNGTLVDPDPLPDGVDPEDVIDDLLGGAQPEDPQEDEYKIIGKFQWKLLVLAVGMIMLLGSPIAGVYYGGDTATWIRILFIMFFGIGILWQIKSM